MMYGVGSVGGFGNIGGFGFVVIGFIVGVVGGFS